MASHIHSICRAAFSYLRVISRQRPFMNDELQGITKYATRLAMRVGDRAHLPAAMEATGWLLVSQSIHHRIACVVFSVLSTGPPVDISLFIQPRPTREFSQTRSTADTLLLQPCHIKSRMGDRAFRSCGPRIWNTPSTDQTVPTRPRI